MAEPNNMWVSIIREKYLKQASLRDYRKSGSTSWQWGKLITLRKQFHEGLKWVVGDGKAIRFWNDLWITDEPLLKVVKNIDSINQELMVHQLLSPDRTWDEHIIRNLLSNHLSNEIITKIMEVPG